MSNHLAVAMVTATLVHTLNEAITHAGDGKVDGATVTTLRPPSLVAKTDAATRGINVFLYHVVPNGIYAAEALPARTHGGRLVRRPRQGLDLHYLLSFTGDESALEPQRLMGLAVAALADRPLLTSAAIRAARDSALNSPWQGYSDLDAQPEPVRLAMVPMTIEEASRLWSSMFHSTYRLSAAYRASVAVVEGLTPEGSRVERPTGVEITVGPSMRRPEPAGPPPVDPGPVGTVTVRDAAPGRE